MGVSVRWVVSVATSETDPVVYGPYSMTKAVELAAKVNASSEKRPRDEQEGDFLYATAYPVHPLGITAIRRDLGLPR